MPSQEKLEEYSRTEKRSSLIVKSNRLVQQTRYDLSAQQQKIVLYIISKIERTDTAFHRYTIDLHEFCEICGIQLVGKNYKNLKDSVKNLSDKSFWMKNGKKEYLLRWFNELSIDTEYNTLSYSIDDRLRPYLLEMKEFYTKYELINILLMKSKYSIRMYEILKSYANLGYYEVSITELKEILMVDAYSDYKNFRVNVLDRAVREINAYTDLEISFKPKRIGRTIQILFFTIKEKESQQKAITHIKDDMELDGEAYD